MDHVISGTCCEGIPATTPPCTFAIVKEGNTGWSVHGFSEGSNMVRIVMASCGGQCKVCMLKV